MDRDQGWELVKSMDRMAEATVWAAAYTDPEPPWDPENPSNKMTRLAYAEKALSDWRKARSEEDAAAQAVRDANEKELEAAMAKGRSPQ